MTRGGLVIGALFAFLGVSCGAFGSSDTNDKGVDTGAAGVVLRGISKSSGVNLREIVVQAPEGGRVGGTVWAVIASSRTNVTPPPGFDVVSSDDGYACGPYGTNMNVFVHAIKEGEPTEYRFGFAGVTVAAASLITLEGLVTGSTAVETSAFERVGMSPFQAPKATASGPTYALVTYLVVGEPALTWTVPNGLMRLFEGNGTAIYGRDVEPGAVIEVAPVQASKADACGIVQLALLRRR